MYKNKIFFTFCIIITFLKTSDLHAMMDMAIMMGAQQGASIANEATSQMFQDMGSALQKDQSTLQNSLSQFSAQVSQAESANAKILGKIFASSIKHVAKEESAQSDYTQQMQDYIFKAISLHKPPLYYLISPLSVATTLDQAFANGTMYTPTGPTWKNIFQYGDWEYDHATDSFYQFKNIPVFSAQTDPTTNATTQSSTNAAYNSIFTEYFTYATSYKIQCEITLYQVQYPFFVGIEFNKTRWISGNADSLSSTRLIGIYAESDNNIGTYYAEKSPLDLYKKQKTTTPIELLNPLDQIIQKTAQQQTSISPTLFTNLYEQPVTFVVHIATSPQKILYKIWPKNTAEPKKFITIKSSHKNLYLYHGIGFIAPGAIAQFKLIKPTELLFSQTAQTDFAQEIKTLLSKK